MILYLHVENLENSKFNNIILVLSSDRIVYIEKYKSESTKNHNFYIKCFGIQLALSRGENVFRILNKMVFGGKKKLTFTLTPI